jgi:hypothetical protein
MFGRFRHFLPAAAWLLGVASLWAEAGYLPQAGPLPLRFRVLPSPVEEEVSAPEPPAPPAPQAPVSLPLPPVPAAAKEPTPVPPIQPVTNGPALEYDAREPAIAVPHGIAPDAPISPQMLIKYFTAPTKPMTNAPTAEIPAAVGFTPPLVATPGSTQTPANKVTYSIPP